MGSTIRFIGFMMVCVAMSASLGAPSIAQDKQLESKPDVYAAFIELRDENAEYDGSYCPPNLDKNSICLDSSVLIQKGIILRILSDKSFPQDSRLKLASGLDERGEYVRFRFIAGHARIRAQSGRYLAILELTDEGYVFLQWKRFNQNGEPCFPKVLLDQYGDRLNLNLGPETEYKTQCVLG